MRIINTMEELNEIINSNVPSMIDFYADWCGPCRVIAPYVEEIAEAFAGKANVVKVNVDTLPDAANLFAVTSIPTIAYVKGGKEFHHLVGYRDKKTLVDTLLTIS